jgi:sulfate adenylyltransferase
MSAATVKEKPSGNATDAIAPHGDGELVDLKAPAAERDALKKHVGALAAVQLSARDQSDLEMLATGAFSPLTGFMGESDYVSARDNLRLASGLPWSIPITLGVEQALAKSLSVGKDVALVTEQGVPLAILKLDEVFQVDRKREAEAVFGTADPAHPGANNVLSTPPFCLAGKVVSFEEIPGRTFLEYPREPRQTRAAFRERGWKKIVAFQTRNPTHRAHEYIQKAALEICDGLMLHPLVGETKGDDVPAAVRMETYKVLLDLYYPKDRAMLAIMPAHMRYGGPREAILHAIVRRNYGCTHFIVGRDHAGVGNYYGSYDAQKIFERFRPGEMGITPLTFENTFFCKSCAGMASYKTCPHGDEDRLILSGTKVREMLRRGESPPPEFTRPEIAAILVRAMRESN